MQQLPSGPIINADAAEQAKPHVPMAPKKENPYNNVHKAVFEHGFVPS